MIADYLNQEAFKVARANWSLYDDEPATSPITLSNVAPSGSFKCRVKLSSVTGHTDLVGHVYINAEDLNFISGVIPRSCRYRAFDHRYLARVCPQQELQVRWMIDAPRRLEADSLRIPCSLIGWRVWLRLCRHL